MASPIQQARLRGLRGAALPLRIPVMTKFLLKTLLYRVFPRAFARVRAARRYRGRLPAMSAAGQSSGWASSNDASFSLRRYSNYGEYISHQSQKYDGILSSRGGFSGRTIALNRVMFRRRFVMAMPLLNCSARVVCVGARDGTEVEVWQDLGYSNAIGLDLNPGPDNPFVIAGDFHNLPYPAESVDFIFSNALDHSNDLSRFFAESARVLKKDGLALYDISKQGASGFEAVDWRDPRDVVTLASGTIGPIIKSTEDDKWLSALFRKS